MDASVRIHLLLPPAPTVDCVHRWTHLFLNLIFLYQNYIQSVSSSPVKDFQKAFFQRLQVDLQRQKLLAEQLLPSPWQVFGMRPQLCAAFVNPDFHMPPNHGQHSCPFPLSLTTSCCQKLDTTRNFGHKRLR